MGRLIDADALMEAYMDDDNNDCGWWYREKLENAPAVEAEPVVHAEWQFDSGCGRVKHYRCTRCGRMCCSMGRIPILEEFPYCHCGAKMTVEKPVESVDK